jgi:UDP-4-amino-4-deoxy-L-arabinose formyltransferase/UDP-glucuronic acid dehydrogenase (UDP-4-keto-hexauronic acid decarboxylating)
MKTIVLAYHDIGCTGIKQLIKHGFEIEAVFTHNDDPKENLWFSSVAETAVAYGLEVFAPEDINHPLWVEKIRQMAPDIIFSFYYRNMVGQEILDVPKLGCLNLHGSLLPAYRGRCPVNWVLINGESETGVSLHYMERTADTGDIVSQLAVDIDDHDTALSLHAKLNSASEQLLESTLPEFHLGTWQRRPQDNSQSSYFGGRSPADGQIDWHQDGRTVRNLVRAVTRPYPGAFTYLDNRKCYIWQVKTVSGDPGKKPGTVLSSEPLIINCTTEALEVEVGQSEGGPIIGGIQLGREMNIAPDMMFGARKDIVRELQRKKRVLILGVNGFIGNHLSERLLDSGRYIVHGMDLSSDSISRLIEHPDFHFSEGDISIHREWIEHHVKKCDIVLPLVAIATPAEYVRNPLRVFELDFEENLRIVRYCAKYGKRVLFPSTSEVYGMCDDDLFDENSSNCVLGPIHKQRWIYSCSKQLLDRVIWAYGATQGLNFTLFRPFNWVGPRLDSLKSARIGSSRVITQLILNLVEGTPIQLVDGGQQKRCFTDVVDGVECLFRIIENSDDCCNGKIFNIGNPLNEASISELATILTEKFEQHPLRHKFPPLAGIHTIESRAFYGSGYQDVQHRRPSIRQASAVLGWNPTVPFVESIEKTLDYFLRDEEGLDI